MPHDLRFDLVQTITHMGTVIVFGQSNGESGDSRDAHKLWYKVLDLEQVADEDQPNAWDDNTRWTDWMEVPFPDELRGVAMSMMTVRLRDERLQTLQTAPGHWQVLSDDADVYLFRAIDFVKDGGSETNFRIYANRYNLLRDASPAGGTNRGASGKEITVPQLKLKSEPRYRRSGMRETPQSDTDRQGYLNMGNEPFKEPTREFWMVTPEEGLFTVVLTPSSIPARKRWQFFWKAPASKIAALSLLRDEDGWVNLEEKYDRFNADPEAPFHLAPDRIFTLTHSGNTLALAGPPDSLLFRSQEESSGPVGNKKQMLSPERVMLAARVQAGAGKKKQLVVVDFGLDDDGAADIAETVPIETVNIARTAFHLNGATDRIVMPAEVPDLDGSMTFQAWVRHNEGEGTLVRRGADREPGFSIEWRPGARKLVATLERGGRRRLRRVEAPLPTSHTWHHIALAVDVQAERAALYIDGAEAAVYKGVLTGFAADGEMTIGGPGKNNPERNWLDFEIDQVVLWSDARVPPEAATNGSKTFPIYRELNEEELALDELLGCWQMDDAHQGAPNETRDRSTHGNHARVEGADHVNQTAPIFKAMDGNFEDTLGGLSVGMGLVAFADKELSDDPHLFLSSDGLVHVYTTAATKADEKEELVALQYDTTNTRAQFRFNWTATAEGTGRSEQGELVLTARTSGPLMNRTRVALEEDGGHHLKLIIENERLGLEETWEKLPKKAVDLITVLNGEAALPKRLPKRVANLVTVVNGQTAIEEAKANGADQQAEAIPEAPKADGADQQTETIYYDYDANVRYKLSPDANVQSERLSVKGAGGKVVAQPSPTFMAYVDRRPRNGAEAVLLPQKAVMRQQGNFGGWVHAPVAVSGAFKVRGDTPTAAVVDLSEDKLLSVPGDFGLEAWVRPDEIAGKIGESRLINLKGDTETAAYAMGLQPAWSLKLGGSQRVPKKVADKQPVLKTWGDDSEQKESYNESFTVGVRFNTPATSNQVGSLFQIISKEHWGHIFYAEVDSEGVWFKFIDQDIQAQGVYAPFEVKPGESVFVAFVWDIATEYIEIDGEEFSKDYRGWMRLFINGEEQDSSIVDWTDYVELRLLNLGAPELDNEDDEYWKLIKERIDELKEHLKDKEPEGLGRRNLGPGPDFEQGCGLAIQEVRIWDFALDAGDLVEPLATRHTRLHWDFSQVAFIGTSAEIQNLGSMTDADSWDLDLSPSQLEPRYQLFAAAGKRQVASHVRIPANQWSHVAAVCTGNHALSFNGRNQRAIVKDSGGLNAEKSFTIDCSLRWNGGATQYLFSKSNAEKSDYIFQVGILSNGKPFLELSLTDASGAEKSLERVEAVGTLMQGVNYHLLVRCWLRPLDYEKSESERYQIWRLDADIWSFNLDEGRWNGVDPQDPKISDQEMQEAVDKRSEYNRLQTHGFFYVTAKNKTNSEIGLRQSEVIASIGSQNGEGETADDPEQGWFDGLVGHLRYWAHALDEAALKRLVITAGLPAGVPRPAGDWRFEENKGLSANDSTGGMAAKLSDETMWTTSRLTSRLSLYIDGRIAGVRHGGYEEIDYGASQLLALGAMAKDATTLEKGFRGQMDDLRIWGDLRTQEEIYDNRHVLLGGNENDLVGYWPLSTASGTLIKDASGRGNHAALNLTTAEDVKAFWKPSEAAPIGNELPQVRNLLDGQQTAWVATGARSAGAGEYGDVQAGAEGQVQAFMKRCQVYLDQEGRCHTVTGFKVGDLDLFYIGQAQSDPTLIGYIEGAPPVPSENATMAHFTSPTRYTFYDNSAAVQLVEAENTVQIFSAESNRGFDYITEMALGYYAKGKYEVGLALGNLISATVLDYEFEILGRLNVENNLDYLSGGGAEIETKRSLINRVETVGDWEGPDDILNLEIGRRYVFDNMGYALVKSGVANVYSMKMRKTGTLMGLTMIPDPDIKEDYNIIMFKIEPTYTRQGTLDGKIGFVDDPDCSADGQEHGSYYRPKEVNNLVEQIDAYEARIAASYADFNAGRLGRRAQGLHFQKDDPAVNALSLIEGNIEMPYDWGEKVSKRNMVNTYVWMAPGGLFVEQQETSVVRAESSGGAYGFKGMAGVSNEGKIGTSASGLAWDAKVLLGGHIETRVVKTRKEGRDFGIDVELAVDGYLRKYTGDPGRFYSATDVPGKVTGYRFKTFYLVPDKRYFDTFWEKVVSKEWLEGNDPNARALRAVRGNTNHVWRVLHRVTSVSRVPPTGEDQPAIAREKPTRAVIHQTPNLAIINRVLDNLVLDVVREATTTNGAAMDGLGLLEHLKEQIGKEQIGEAVADLIDRQWAERVPWWKGYMEAAEAAPGDPGFEELKDIKQAVYEYMLAYFETGAVDENRRFSLPPRIIDGSGHGGDGGDGYDGEAVIPATMADLAERATHLYTFSQETLATDVKGADDIEVHDGAEVIPGSDIPGCQGKLLLPFDRPGARGVVGTTFDWGRDADRTWEMVFRIKGSGRGLLLSPDPRNPAPQPQRIIQGLGFDLLPENRDAFSLYVQPAGDDAPVSLGELDTGKTVYVAMSYEDASNDLRIFWGMEGDPEPHAFRLETGPEGRMAGGWLYFGGALKQLSDSPPDSAIEIHHFAVYDGVFDDRALQQRWKALALDPSRPINLQEPLP